MTQRYIDIGDGCRLFIREEGKGFPIVLGHSLTFDHEMWEHQLARLAQKYRVIGVDFRGHGKTSNPYGEITLDTLADDLARLVDHLQVERVGYCGLSMGGMVGMRLALRHPAKIAALALLNTTAEAEPDEVRVMYDKVNESSRFGEPNEATIAFVLQLMFSESFRQSHPEVTSKFHHKLRHPNQEGTYWVARAVIHRESILDAIARIAAPTLVVVSDADNAVPSIYGENIAKQIPGASLERIRGSGHMTAVERADEVTSLLEAFFNKHCLTHA